MVLQPSNSSGRKSSNAENMAPRAKASSSTKATRVSVAESIREASKRRRARTSGVATTSRYAVEQAKRKAIKLAPVRIDVALPTPPTSPRNNAMDVDATPVLPAPMRGSINLPRLLARPDFREVSQETLTAIHKNYAEVPVAYVRDTLATLGPLMDPVRLTTKMTAPKGTLPSELEITVNSNTSDAPTHLLAVSPQQSTDAVRHFTLYAIHSIVFAAHCSSLQLPASKPGVVEPGTSIKIPVVPIGIPHLESFAPLSTYLYTKGAVSILSYILPEAFTLPASEEEKKEPAQVIAAFAKKLAGTYTSQKLFQHLMKVNGLWRNVCALGIFHDGIWALIDLCWEILLMALAISTGQVQSLSRAMQLTAA